MTEVNLSGGHASVLKTDDCDVSRVVVRGAAHNNPLIRAKAERSKAVVPNRSARSPWVSSARFGWAHGQRWYETGEDAHGGYKKLIEVALPLEAINRESAREKSIRHGHPSTLHLWWARRPLGGLSSDPIRFSTSTIPLLIPTNSRPRKRSRLSGSGCSRSSRTLSSGTTPPTRRSWKPHAARSCARAVTIRRRSTTRSAVEGRSRSKRSGLACQRTRSDLNPVAVLITKALIEIPPKFAGRPPVHPGDGRLNGTATWQGAQGLAEDVRYYGKWMRDEAERRIGHLYPRVRLPERRPRGDRDRLDMGSDSQVAQPRMGWADAAGSLVRPLD